MPSTMLSRLFCFLRNKDIPNPSPPSPLPTMRPNSTTTASTLPNEKTSIISTRWPPHPKTRTLILDLGDVLFHYSVREITALPPLTFKAVIKSPAWGDLECGRVTEDIAVIRISQDLSLDISIIREALSQCRSLLHVDHNLFSQLVALKKEMNSGLKVVAMTNISKDDFARLKLLLPNWDELFDGDFTSFEAGRIKPDLGYYRHVIDSIGLTDPKEAVFVDDKLVNVDAARCFGIYGIVFETPEVLVRQLRSQLMDLHLPV